MTATERTVEGLFIRERGSGPAVVLLHGFPQTGACWDRVAAPLSSRYRVIVPDLPGYGRSDPPRTAAAGPVAASIVRALAAAGVHRFTFVGHDFGGSIGFRMALDHPDTVERLVVVNAPFRKLDLRRGWHLVAFNLPVLPEVAFAVAGRAIVPWMIRAGAGDASALDPVRLRLYAGAFSGLREARNALAYYRTTTRAAVIAGIRASLPPPLRRTGAGRRRKVQQPTLLVWGMRDRFIPPSLIEGIRKDVPDCQVVEIAEAGHFVPDEAPDALAAAIASFMRGRGRGPARSPARADGADRGVRRS